MLIQRINISLLSLLVAFAPSLVWAEAALALPSPYNVASITQTSSTAVAANDAGYAVAIADSTGTVVATDVVGGSAAALGTAAIGLMAAGAVGYGIGTALNNAFGISDAVAAALAGASISVVDGVPMINPPVQGGCTTNCQYLYSSIDSNGVSVITGLSTAESNLSGQWSRYNGSSVSFGGSEPVISMNITDSQGNSAGTRYLYGTLNPNYDANVKPKMVPASPAQVGAAIGGDPAATAETAASAAQAAANGANKPNIDSCAKAGGVYNLNTSSCGAAPAPATPSDPNKDAANQTAKDANKAADDAKKAADDAKKDSDANPTDQTKKDTATAAAAAAQQAALNAIKANTAATAANTAKPAPASLPPFCSWATSVCEFITWMKTDDTDKDTNLNFDQPTPATDTTVSFNANCPASITLADFDFNGQSIHWEVNFSQLCDTLTTFVRPVVIAMGGLSAVLIISGTRENG